jgi:hypothetical protein
MKANFSTKAVYIKLPKTDAPLSTGSINSRPVLGSSKIRIGDIRHKHIMFKHRTLKYIFFVENRNELSPLREDLKSYSSGKVRDRKGLAAKTGVCCALCRKKRLWLNIKPQWVVWTTPPHFSMHLNGSVHLIA